MQTRGERISLGRKRIGFKQTELAKMLDVHVTTLRRWERDVGEPRTSDLRTLCKILRIPEADLANAPGKERKMARKKTKKAS